MNNSQPIITNNFFVVKTLISVVIKNKTKDKRKRASRATALDDRITNILVRRQQHDSPTGSNSTQPALSNNRKRVMMDLFQDSQQRR